jgi:FKBP-type peptidyl-prolyl cis-trans isomerase FklB
MNKKCNLLLLLFSLTTFAMLGQYSGNAAAGSGSTKLEFQIDSVSYCMGIDLTNMMMQSGVQEINLAAFIDGMVKTLNKDTSNLKIKIAYTRPIIMDYIKKVQDVKNDKNKKEGEDFLAKNKKNPGVKVTESGVQYIILKKGNGPIPSDTSIVKVHYHGTLINGTVFDSSIDRGEPVEFPVNRVIKGWQDILTKMPVGSKWKVFIPQELAYGASVRPGGKIEPYMALIFEIELIDIIKKNPDNNE